MIKYAFLVASAALFASSASAADFNGPRAEVRLGLDDVNARLSATVDGTSDSLKGSKNDFGAGLELGYDLQPGDAFMLGAYLGADASSVKSCSEAFGDDEACLKLNRNLYAGVRAGAVIGNKVAVYAKGGLSRGRGKLTYRDLLDPTENFSTSDNRGGYHFGAGVEANVGANGFVKAEFIRTNYKAYTYAEPGVRASADFSRNQYMAGFGLRF